MPLLHRRASAGYVRRCHGDMHLGNLVLWRGRPTLFDAIEFDEDLATIDVLYDLAFLLMDLDRRGQRRAASIVLSGSLALSGAQIELEAVRALPVLLAIRAAVRAMVAVDRAAVAADAAQREATLAHAAATLQLALGFLAPPPPRLLLVGGLSGTGKSTLARSLAPLVGPAPGAIHLRSDVERKRLAGVDPLQRLPPAAYTEAAAAEVYRSLTARARILLAAGQSVVADAVFARAEERRAMLTMAAELGVAADGVWLDVDQRVMQARVAGRVGDASDATPAVVERQLKYDLGTIDWVRIDAGHSASATLDATVAALRLGDRPTGA